MAYCIRRKKSVATSVRKVAREQVEKARAEIENTDLDRHEVVHQVRKRCKKMRGLIRLVRPVFPAYKKENRYFRDAARKLSYVRDAQSIIESVDMLADHYRDNVDDQLFEPIRWQLSLRRQEISKDTGGLEKRLKDFHARMEEALPRIDAWQIKADGFDSLSGGLQKTYRRGRKTFTRAYQEPSTENFHEWRKRVKYHWYHLRLLRRIWPIMLKAHRRAADELSDLLGDDHDLAVLAETLEREPERFGGRKQLQVVLGLIDRHRMELQHKARPLGELLYAEKQGSIVKRFRSYWTTWR